MRLELAGSLIQPDPLVLTFTANQTFVTQTYIDLGYTHFDVICIGGGGGMGGGIDTGNIGTLVRNFGGTGGGGGLHRVRGLLSALPGTCPIVVGDGGGFGAEQASNPAFTTDGGDGGVSSFNNTTCLASGGKGGKRAQSNSTDITPLSNGGDGGLGNRGAAGGGALGGVSGTPSSTGPSTPGTAGKDGTWFNNVGQGGGGGSGGVGRYGGIMYLAATSGGRGSYNPGDTSVYGPGSPQFADPNTGTPNVIPGGASGAKASPLNGLPTVYGQSKSGVITSSQPGIVVIRLTEE